MNAREQDFLRYEAFRKEQERTQELSQKLSPDFGATALLSTIALGVIDAPRPNMETKEVNTTTGFEVRDLGYRALSGVMYETPAERTAPAPLGYRHEYALAS